MAPDNVAPVAVIVQNSELLTALTQLPLLPLGFDAVAETVIDCPEDPRVGLVSVNG